MKSISSLTVSLALLLFCASPAPASTKAPLPRMPANWKVFKDYNASPGEVKSISKKLGGELKALRNTLYNVDGNSVKLNVLLAASKSDADKIWAKIRSFKSEIALLRKGVIIYEFVGKNHVLHLIKQGKAHLAK